MLRTKALQPVRSPQELQDEISSIFLNGKVNVYQPLPTTETITKDNLLVVIHNFKTVDAMDAALIVLKTVLHKDIDDCYDKFIRYMADDDLVSEKHRAALQSDLPLLHLIIYFQTARTSYS